jgi:demethylspheroidene O-methyltransferase
MTTVIFSPTLYERYIALRDRLTGDAGFRRWASRFFLTRWVARRQAKALFDLNTGFVYTQVLQACVRLEVFEALRQGPLTLEQLARRTALPPQNCRVLMRAAESLQLLETRSSQSQEEAFGLGFLGAALLDNPAVLGMVRHHALFYRDLADPIALLRGETTASLKQYWAYSGTEPSKSEGPQAHAVASYSELMSASQPLVLDQVLDAYSFRPHRVVLDIGGGEGTFIRSVMAQYPDLEGWVMDLPAVAERAELAMKRTMADRKWRVFPGDFRTTPFPVGADLITLVRVAHDHDDDVVLDLFRNILNVLKKGGRLLIAEPLAQTSGAKAMGNAYFGMFFLAMGSGRPRSFHELKRMLLQAGFDSVALIPNGIPLQTSVIVANRDD